MAFHGLRRGDIAINGINGGEQFGLRWHRLLFPTEGMPAVHLGPLSPVHFGPVAESTDANAAPQVYGHAEPTLSIPIDETSIPSDDSAAGAPSAGGAPAPAVADEARVPDEANPFWHPPYFAPSPLTESHDVPALPSEPPSGDTQPPAGFIPKSEAIVWSGPAVMAFPGEPHDTGGSAAAPDATGAPDTATTDLPGAISRADLDPILTAMGSGPDHGAPSGTGGADLGTAFLPPGSGDSDLAHGLDSGFGFTPPPLPPPPDIIG